MSANNAMHARTRAAAASPLMIACIIVHHLSTVARHGWHTLARAILYIYYLFFFFYLK